MKNCYRTLKNRNSIHISVWNIHKNSIHINCMEKNGESGGWRQGHGHSKRVIWYDVINKSICHHKVQPVSASNIWHIDLNNFVLTIILSCLYKSMNLYVYCLLDFCRCNMIILIFQVESHYEFVSQEEVLMTFR